MTLYKFLAPSRRHPLSGVEFPPAGAWIGQGDPASDGPEGIRAYALGDLAYWVNDELWEVELGGGITTLPHSTIAPSGRLVRRVDAWTAATGHDLVIAALWRARAHVTEQLAAAGHVDVVAELRAPTSLADFGAIAAAVATPAGWADSIGLLIEASDEAVNAGVAVALLTATVAVAGWDEVAQAVERRWQSEWIAAHLGLGPP